MQTAHTLCNSHFSWSPAAPSRRVQHHGHKSCHSVSNSDPGQNADSRPAAALGAVELPGGVLWWNDKQHNVYKHDVVYGQDFVLQRPRSGGPGLVLSHRLSSVQIVDKAERARVHLEMYRASQSSTGVQLFRDETVDFDLTDYALIEESSTELPESAEPEQFPPTPCLGIVLRDQTEGTQQQVNCNCLAKVS